MDAVDSPPPSPLQVAVRAEGVTPAERYLQKLCDHSFLSLWSYPSVFRDQRAGCTGDGKELCDLLVVCGDDVLIFSDKSCAFPATGKVELDWSRWFKKAILKSAEQAWGAERWLREYPTRVFLDRRCTQAFPLEIPPRDRIRVHLIIVAHNVAARCAAHFPGSSSTLVFDSGLRGGDHFVDVGQVRPFEVGWIDETKRFVHVLDDASVDLLLSYRDTITDFVEFLRWKESLLLEAETRGVRIMYCGEEDLLATYLKTMTDGRHGFQLPRDSNLFFLEEGEWNDFQSSPQREFQVRADQVSYSWDALIETFNKNILAGTSFDRNSFLISDREKVMRFLAREPRIRRRLLADAWIGLIEKTKGTYRATRVIMPSKQGDPYYCFLLVPPFEKMPREEYRPARGRQLEALCRITKLMYPDAIDIVGLATETGIDTVFRSEDALYLDAREWNEDDQSHARELQAASGLLTNVTWSHKRDWEFPVPDSVLHRRDSSIAAPGRNPRNKPCPCGSGAKYKKCHGR